MSEAHVILIIYFTSEQGFICFTPNEVKTNWLFKEIGTWKQPKHLSTGGWIKKKVTHTYNEIVLSHKK